MGGNVYAGLAVASLDSTTLETVTFDNAAVTSAEYLLTTQISPAGAGTVTPATGVVSAGSTVPLTATPNSGYIFTGWTGNVDNPASASTTITMTTPQTVTANFNGGPTSLGGSLGIKSGSQNARMWPLTIGSNGPGMALGAEISNLVLLQTQGQACTPSPVIHGLPAVAGDLAPYTTGTATLTIDFSGCQSGAIFKATFTLSANAGAATGTVVKYSQLP